jgi:very-short-patch-repair endonuclease
MRQQPGTGLLKTANSQFGVVTAADLARAGVAPSTITRWVREGRLTRLHRGIYALGHVALQREGHWLAAVWACGPGAVLSHSSAAAFHAMCPETTDAAVHVSTTRRAESRVGIEVHRVRYLAPVDVFRPHPLRVTHVPRTLIDLADVLPWEEYRKAADSLPRLQPEKVREAQDRAPGRRGAPLVRRLIEADDAHTKSEFERRFLRFLKSHSLPRPNSLNDWAAGHKADCIYDRLIVELDGRTHHKRRAQMRKDRQRDTDYQLAGYRILRLLWGDLHPDEAKRTAKRVRQMLAAGAGT